MSVAFERPPQWRLPGPSGVRHGSTARAGGTVVAFPSDRVPGRTGPGIDPSARPESSVVSGEIDLPVALAEVAGGIAEQWTAEQWTAEPEEWRRTRAAPAVRRGPSTCPTSVPPRAPALRLTTRGRRLVRLLEAGAVLALLAVGAWCAAARFSGPVVPDTAPAVVVVHRGDSLWSIAHQIAPHSDPRQVVAALQERNHLRSPVVHVGQHLRVPR